MEKNIFGTLSDFIDESVWLPIRNALFKAFSEEKEDLVRIAVIGESGVGKTSTINALFNTDLPVSHTGSCTQNPDPVQVTTEKGTIEVIDMPGLFAGEKESIRHWETYRKVLPTVDCAIWVVSAGDRALEGMQRALEIIGKFPDSNILERIVFAINKAEHMYDEEWDNKVNLPSKVQSYYLEVFCETVRKAIVEKFPDWKGTIKYYSALKHFRLDELLEAMLLTAGSDNIIKVYRMADTKKYEDIVRDKRALEVAQGMVEGE